MIVRTNRVRLGQEPADLYLYAVDQKNLFVPSPASIYGSYVKSLIGFLLFFYLLVNQVVKVKRT